MLRVSTGLVIAVLAAAPAFAQDIAITNTAYHLIPDGMATASTFPNTRFQDTEVGEGDGKQFFIYNDSNNAVLNITAWSITGPDAAAFSFTDTPGPSIGTGPNDSEYFIVSFDPPAAGVYNAQVNIFSNDPDSEDTYTFAISGTGYVGFPFSVPNLQANVSKSSSKQSNSGITKVKGKLAISNLKPLQVDSGIVEVYVTPKRYLDNTAELYTTKKLKKVKGQTPEKTYARFVKTAVKTELEAGYIFYAAFPLEPIEEDTEWASNVTRLQFPVPVD